MTDKIEPEAPRRHRHPSPNLHLEQLKQLGMIHVVRVTDPVDTSNDAHDTYVQGVDK